MLNPEEFLSSEALSLKEKNIYSPPHRCLNICQDKKKSSLQSSYPGRQRSNFKQRRMPLGNTLDNLWAVIDSIPSTKGNIYSPPHIRASLAKYSSLKGKVTHSHFSNQCIPNLETIELEIKDGSIENIQDMCVGYRLICRWNGFGVSIGEIADWLKSIWNKEVTVSILPDNFIYLDFSRKCLK